MKIKLPYVYAVNGRRGRFSKTVHHIDHLEADITEISGDDAPIAAEWTTKSTIAAGYERSQCRFHNGDFFMQVREEIPSSVLRDLDKKAMSSSHAEQITRMLGMTPGKQDTEVLRRVLRGISPVGGNAGHVLDVQTSSDEYLRHRRASFLLSSFLLVDGTLWTKVNEPKLKATYAENDVTAIVTVDTRYDNRMFERDMGHHAQRSKDATDLFFNVSDFDTMTDFLTNEGAVSSGIHELVVHHLPDAFTFDGRKHRPIEIAQELTRITQKNAGYLEGDGLQAWLELRELSSHHVVPGGAEPEQLLPLIDRVLAAAPRTEDYRQIAGELEFTRKLLSAYRTTHGQVMEIGVKL